MNFILISARDFQNKNIIIQTNSIELLTQEIESLTKQIETQREEIQSLMRNGILYLCLFFFTIFLHFIGFQSTSRLSQLPYCKVNQGHKQFDGFDLSGIRNRGALFAEYA